ncbi:MAG TPA: hypothetical protein VD908_06205 [Cytophagales bacterium]|nr:hypothetical protein [Cytophagales bacterium]
MKKIPKVPLTKNYFLLVFLLSSLSYATRAQEKSRFDLAELNKDNKLQKYSNTKLERISSDAKGINCEGVAWLKDVDFSEGIIEVDLRGKDLMQQSFLGIAFHGVDSITYDAIYFRPFNFQSSDSIRRTHAVQYISHPEYGWDNLREAFPGRYESAVLPVPNPNDWFHARIVVEDSKISVFVNDSETPSLVVEKLNSRKNGLIGLWSVALAGGFDNLSITKFSEK